MKVSQEGVDGSARAVVAIQDTGVGIPAHKLPAIFELFAQVDESLERSRGGLGIGLTLVRNLVERHDGVVSAASAGPGRGSEFVVKLPLATSPTALASGTLSTEDRSRQRGLPGLDGYRVAQELRARMGDGLRLIAITGYGGPEDRHRALQAGFDHHLVKPVKPDELGRLLTSL